MEGVAASSGEGRDVTGGVEASSDGFPDLAEAARALDRCTEAVLSLGPDSTIRYANAALLEMVGRRPDDLLGRDVWEVFPHLRGSPFQTRLERAVAGGSPTEDEAFSARADRRLLRRFYPAADGVTVVVGERPLPSDLSGDGDRDEELRTSLERARAAEQRYRDVLDGMTEGVTETTATGDFIVVNAAFARMMGYADPADLLSQVTNAAELYADSAHRSAAVARVADDGDGTLEVQMRRRTGDTVWVRARATVRYAAGGEVGSLLAVIEDVTARREAQRLRRETEERIEERERTRLAEAVHDDPLQLVVAALLRLDGLQPQLPETLTEPVDHVAGMLEDAVERLRHLIVALSPPDLAGGLGPALRVLAEGVFVGTSTQVELEGPADVPLSPDVQALVYRVLREALVNARKHARAGRVVIGLAVHPDEVRVGVRDDGVGGASPVSEPGHLGMSTMLSRAAALGAALTLDSPPGGGTGVELVVPRSED